MKIEPTELLRQIQLVFGKTGNANDVKLLNLLNLLNQNSLTGLTELTGLTGLTELTGLTGLTNKQKILFSLVKGEKTLSEIGKDIKVDYRLLYNDLQHKERQSGLVLEGLVNFDELTKKYSLLPKGEQETVKLVKDFLLNLKNQADIESRKLAAAELECKLAHVARGILKKKPIDSNSLWCEFKDIAYLSPSVADELLDDPIETFKAMEIAMEGIV